MSAANLPLVLLVDDDEDVPYLFLRYAQGAGIKNPIHIAEGGEAAKIYLTGCLEGKLPWPCAVFLDINMPRISGFEVLAWMRERQVDTKTVIVMHSSSSDPRHVKTAFAGGAHAFVSKSELPKMLKDIVETAMLLCSRTELLARLHAVGCTARPW